MRPLYIIIICFSLLGLSNISGVQGGEFKMPIIKKGVWKGIVPVSFKGRINDSKTNEAIKKFSVCEIINGVAHKGQLESEGRTIDLGPQTIETKNGDYNFTLYIATLNGQTLVRDSKQLRVLGPASESIIIEISAEGDENKIIIAKDKIVVGEDNHLDITLDNTGQANK